MRTIHLKVLRAQNMRARSGEKNRCIWSVTSLGGDDVAPFRVFRIAVRYVQSGAITPHSPHISSPYRVSFWSCSGSRADVCFEIRMRNDIGRVKFALRIRRFSNSFRSDSGF